MPTFPAFDDLNGTLPILGFVYNGCQKLVANTSSANVSNSVGTYGYTVYTVIADQPVLFEHRLNAAPVIGSGSHYLPANTPMDIKVRDRGQVSNTYFAFQALTVAANVYLSPRG